MLFRSAVTARAETNAVAPAVRVAEPAPRFELSDLAGKTVKLADCPSQAVIVCFFLSGDRPSERVMRPLATLQSEHATNDLAVFGIALDSGPASALQAKLTEWAVKFPVLRFNMEVVEGFGGISAVPTTFVIDQNRNIIQRYVGFVDVQQLKTDLKVIWRR